MKICPLCGSTSWSYNAAFPEGQRELHCFGKRGCGYWVTDGTPPRSGVNPFACRMHHNCLPEVRYPYNVSAPMNDNWISWGQEIR